MAIIPQMPKREVTIPDEKTLEVAREAQRHVEESIRLLEQIETDNPTIDDFVDVRYAQRKLHSGLGGIKDFINLPNTGKIIK